jgi:hypothetical protein
LRGKLDSGGRLLPDRMEDTLTDAVFSALRYLPRRVVLPVVLAAVCPNAPFTEAELDDAEILFWPKMLWAQRRIEPDVVVVVGDHVVVFEAKYRSGFSRYPLGDQDLNQLAVQWWAASSWAAARRAKIVTVVALTAGAAPPAEVAEAREQLTIAAAGTPPDDLAAAIQWMHWRSFARIFRTAQGLRPHEDAVRHDVLALMDKRGVSCVFEGFEAEDYWLVTSAQRVAIKRVYPAISTLVVELRSLLPADQISWGWPQAGMWAHGGYGCQNPQDWAKTLVAAFWPNHWSRRTSKKSPDHIALYVMFDFFNPAVEVGYVQSPPSTPAAVPPSWRQHFDTLADQLAGIKNSGYTVAADNGDWPKPFAETPATAATAQWLSGLGPFTHLRLHRRLDVADVTTTLVRETMLEVRDVVDACPALHEALRSTNQLAPAADEEGELTVVTEIPPDVA